MSSAWIPSDAFLISNGMKMTSLNLSFIQDIVFFVGFTGMQVSIRIFCISVIFRSYQTVFSARSMRAMSCRPLKFFFVLKVFVVATAFDFTHAPAKPGCFTCSIYLDLLKKP